MSIGWPRRPRIASGSDRMPLANTWRASSDENSTADPNGAPVPIMNDPATRPTISAARRLSRTVFA